MKLRTIWIVTLFLTLSFFPAICGNVGASEKLVSGNHNFHSLNNNYTWVLFCFGFISGVQEIRCGYGIVGWQFNARNAICIIDFKDRPLFCHFKNGEVLAMSPPPIIGGILTDHFVCAFQW